MAALLCAFAAAGAVTGTPAGRADALGYLVNVTVRPGYSFPDAEAALRYGYRVCERVGRGDSYPNLVADVMTDFSATDEYQGTYLIGQAVNELCPQLIWQLRNAAVHYTGPAS